MPVKSTSEEAFARAELMRKDWHEKKFTTYTSLALHYDVSINYARNVILGIKCVRLDPLGKEGRDWKYVSLEGIKYAVYRDGRVWSCSTNSFKQFTPNEDGYLVFRLRREDKKGNRKFSVHRLVLSTFGRKPKPGEQARHLDDDRSNNHFSNLKWGYQEDNSKDMLINGGVAIGEESSGAKLTERQVLRIVKDFNAQSLPIKTFSRQYIEKKSLDIGLTALREILDGTTWSHVTGIRSDSVPEERNELPEKIVKAIHRNYAKVGGGKKKFCQAFSAFLQREGYEVGWITVSKVLSGSICKV